MLSAAAPLEVDALVNERTPRRLRGRHIHGPGPHGAPSDALHMQGAGTDTSQGSRGATSDPLEGWAGWMGVGTGAGKFV